MMLILIKPGQQLIFLCSILIRLKLLLTVTNRQQLPVTHRRKQVVSIVTSGDLRLLDERSVFGQVVSCFLRVSGVEDFGSGRLDGVVLVTVVVVFEFESVGELTGLTAISSYCSQ